MFFDSFNFNDYFKQIYNSFNRPVKDMYPFKAYNIGDKGYIVVCNTLGIDKENLTVGIENEKGKPYPTLKIKGSTKIEKISFENTVNLGIELRIDGEIEKTSYEVKNGLTIVYIKLKQEEIKKIEVEELPDDFTGFDW